MENKLIVLYFESTDDDHCYKMDTETWNQAPIVGQLANFVCVKIDFQQMRQSSNLIRNDINKKLAVRYRVSYLPTTVVIDFLGHVYLQVEGFVREQEMKNHLDQLPTDLSHVYSLLSALEKDPGNVGLKIAAADSLQRLKQYKISNEYYMETAGEETLRISRRLAEHVDWGTAMNFFGLNEVHASIDALERILDKYPGSAKRPEQLFMLVKLYLRALNEVRAREYADELEKEFPGNPFSKQAAELFGN